jgi:integrase
MGTTSNGPRDAETSGDPATKGATLVTHEAFHGAATRTPVIHGGRRVPGLHQRTLADGAVVYEARLRIDGKDTRVVLGATTKSDAVREYQALRSDRDRGDIHENRLINPTVSEVCDETLDRMAMRVGSRDEKLRVSPLTIKKYKTTITCYIGPVLGRKRIADVDIVDIRRLVDTLQAQKLAPSTVTSAISVTSRLFAFAIKQGYTDRNIVKDLDYDEKPGAKRLTEPRYLTEEEIRRLLDAAHPHYRPQFAVCAYAGLRSGEMRGLQWGDIDFDAGRLRVNRQAGRGGEITPTTKTPGSQASVPILPALRRELLAHRQDMADTNIASLGPDRFVFMKTTGHKLNRGKPHGPREVYAAVRKAGDKAGLNPPGLPPVGLHDLRHSFVALALEHGATLPEAAELARHSNPQTTLSVYAGLTKDGRGRAAQKLLDAGFGT